MSPTRAGSITHFSGLRSARASACSTTGTLKPNQRLSASSIDFLPDRPLETRRDEADPVQAARGWRLRRVGAVDKERERVVHQQRVFLGFVVALENAADGGDVRQLGEQIARNPGQRFINAGLGQRTGLGIG